MCASGRRYSGRAGRALATCPLRPNSQQSTRRSSTVPKFFERPFVIALIAVGAMHDRDGESDRGRCLHAAGNFEIFATTRAYHADPAPIGRTQGQRLSATLLDNAEKCRILPVGWYVGRASDLPFRISLFVVANKNEAEVFLRRRPATHPAQALHGEQCRKDYGASPSAAEQVQSFCIWIASENSCGNDGKSAGSTY